MVMERKVSQMFGECHAHLFMNGYNYKEAVNLHRNRIERDTIKNYLLEYQKRGIRFIRDGGDDLGVSSYVKTIAADYGIDYRSPIFAIHKNGHYGSIVGKGFDTMAEYAALVKEAKEKGADFIKIMISGLVDFGQFGVITSSPLKREEIREMIHIAHEEGMAVMTHANGSENAKDAAECRADSIEHGRYIDAEAIKAMAEFRTIWVPTLVTVKNLLGCGRYPDETVREIYQVDVQNIRLGKKLGVQMALGSDAGAYMVPHGEGIEDEYQSFAEIFSPSEALDDYLEAGESAIQERFQRG